MSHVLVVSILIGALFASCFVLARLYLDRTLSRAGERLHQIELEIARYQSFGTYFMCEDRVTADRSVASLRQSLRVLHNLHILLRSRRRSLMREYQVRIDSAGRFLDTYPAEYAKREVERHRNFFHGRAFDQDQIQAIVKKDLRHLVVAAAGSGKTRTLTARIAYLVECGIVPQSILALAYTNPAEDEMRSRLETEYSVSNVKVKTFHSLARELARLSPGFRSGVADASRQAQFIKEIISRLQEDRKFATLLLSFAVESRNLEADFQNFASLEKYHQFLQNQKHLALDGTRVKSIDEKDIANFLFLNGIEFEYETPARWADHTNHYRQYQPDFFLPKYRIWIEHWAIDTHGLVPKGFSHDKSDDASRRYKEGMEWKRAQFRKHGQTLVETYHYQRDDGTLISGLKHHLQKKQVAFRELTLPEILAQIRKMSHNTDAFQDVMLSFLSKAKTNCLTIDDVRDRLKTGNWTGRQRAFASMMIRIWQEYEGLMQKNDMIDFNDMISYALDVARADPRACGHYSHILIDEFQDITDPQVQIIRYLLSGKEGSTLFCVGDDRQNIFSFAGSNIRNILNFDEAFPFAERTVLSTNYRCPKNIVEASNFVSNLNKARLETRIVPFSEKECPIQMVEMPEDAGQTYDEWEYQKTVELLKQMIGKRTRGETILVLSRINYPLRKLELEFPRADVADLKFLSIHRAKGTEADYVLLLGCVNGKNGFPSEIAKQQLVDIVEKVPVDEEGRLEEERRLFYVALTRCKKQFYLFTSKNARSQFVLELGPYLTVQ